MTPERADNLYRAEHVIDRGQACACKHCPHRIGVGGVFCKVCREGRHEPRCQVSVTHR